MSRTLETVKRTASARRSATAAYRAAIVDARKAGHSLPEIGQAAGVTYQAVADLLRRHAPKEGSE